MQLSKFLNNLFSDGKVRVSRTICDFDASDLEVSTQLLAEFDRSERLEMPAGLPDLNEETALWAAQYLYRSIQFVLLRELDANSMDTNLRRYTGVADASAIWSADLLFRHLGPLLKFSSRISPDDPLVHNLKETAAAWPLSSVGLNIRTNVDTRPILNSPALKTIYLDRIIAHRDLIRLGDAELTVLRETMGLYQEQFWPGLELNELTKHD
ncbi:hypothetical protein G7092_21185 [Mucilaginibacter sp. HC2]|uniref:hypothetical protein n=1 Tax=Mucilaginibacter inviolabilis TaxID=2714892 RepID=UPI00140D54A8|nr:hypothetical protein [Mucilaginibacter inviolabilis]NHA06337.1 hypothetical protein [Mucilaginibacter inviolabilis]